MAHKKSKEKVEAFNVGTGNGYSVLEVIRAFEKSTGEKLNYKIAPRRAGDVEKVWSETTLANNELGWKAEKNIEEMMASAWKWQLALEKK
jgi:UDP-glucose 4-epimerase